MYGTFDFLYTAADPNLGYPADEDRLVQRWLWYSLDDTSYGGALFDPYSFRRLQLGADFGNYVAAITPTFDIVAVRVGQIPPVPYLPTDAVTVTLQSQISIIGNNALAQNILIRFFEDNGNQIGADQIISGTLPGEQFTTREVTVTWPSLTLGAHAMRVVADAGSAVYECNKSNNQVTGIALVATRQLFLPVITRQ